mgnify:CR=1 FL=1
MPNSFTPDFTLILNRPEGADIMEDEWEDICQEIFQDLKAEIEREGLDIQMEPERVQPMMGPDEIELFQNLLIGFGIASVHLRYLLNKLIEMEKLKLEKKKIQVQENAMKISIQSKDEWEAQIEGDRNNIEEIAVALAEKLEGE